MAGAGLGVTGGSTGRTVAGGAVGGAVTTGAVGGGVVGATVAVGDGVGLADGGVAVGTELGVGIACWPTLARGGKASDFWPCRALSMKALKIAAGTVPP